MLRESCYFFIYSDAGCILRDANYESHTLKGKELPNQQECQKWCQETEECEVFVYGRDFDITKNGLTYKPKASICFLKKNVTNILSQKKGLVAGQKFCPIYGEIIIFLKSKR